MLEWEHYGPNAVLLRFGDQVGEEAFCRGRSLVAALEANPPPGLVEVVPAFTTLLLEFDPHIWSKVSDSLEAWIGQLQGAVGGPPPDSRVVEIPVVYDGPDLERVAKHAQLSVDEVCDLHAGPLYRVYCLGFSPGFPYLGDLDRRLHTPRLDNPRARIPRGSVAIGGEHTGIYSVDSPGGWNIIGHTPAQLFDRNRRGPGGEDEGMFLLHPGDQVKFKRAEGES